MSDQPTTTAPDTDSQAATCESFCRSCMRVMPPYWVSPSRCAKILGRDKSEIDSAVQNAGLPFSKQGRSYKINWRDALEYFRQMDEENRLRVQRAINASPLSRNKVTGDINNKPRRTANVRPVDVNVR